MQKLFQEVLELGITGGGIVPVILFIRFILRHSPGTFSYLLWSIPAVRLMIPISFSGIWGFLADTKVGRRLGDLSGIQDKFLLNMGKNSGKMVKHEFILNRIATGGQRQVISDQATEGFNKQGSMTCLVIIWLVGVGVMLGYGVTSYIRLWHRVQISIRMKENIYLVDSISTGFVMGLVHPKIYLPSFLSEEEQGYIIRHERIHIKRYDYLIKPMAYFLLCIYWFNPFVWLGFCMFARDMEMSCDEQVVKGQNRQERKRYAGVMIRLAAKKACVEILPKFHGSSITRRVKNIMREKKNSKKIKAVSAVVVLLAALLFVPNCMKAEGKDQEGESVVMPVMQDDFVGENGRESEEVIEPCLVLSKDIERFGNKYPGYLCLGEICNPGECRYSTSELEEMFHKIADRWAQEVPLAAEPGTLYFNQEISDHLAAAYSCDVVIQMDFEVPESSENSIFESGTYEKYNWCLEKDESGNWIVR